MKARLDQLLLDGKLALSLESARAMIGAGQVYVDDRIADKPGYTYPCSVKIRVKERCPFVSRGGLKLAAGLTYFQIDPTDYTCLDIGASTGGFSDCLLQHNARKVFAVDVAYGQLSWKIRKDPRVVVLERFNARNISRKDIHEEIIHLAVMDVSFISITTLLPPLIRLFHNNVAILTLIKPQFELPRADIGSGGVVTDPVLHHKVIKKIDCFLKEIGLVNMGVIPSPINGPKGNSEFLVYMISPPQTIL